MTTPTSSLRRFLRRRGRPQGGQAPRVVDPVPQGPTVDIAPTDPILTYMASANGAVDLRTLELASPAVQALREAGVALVVPLVTQGELIGLLNLGPRLSDQEYSREDRKLLDDLAGYAAPAVRVAQLVRQQEAEVRERSRIEQELRVATLIQQQFLPKELPSLDGWHVAAHYQPAREVGGDFYDFIDLPGDQIGIVVGDVTDKGVPAALIMAKTHSILRSDAPRLVAPGAVLARANELLVAEMPAHMFVTCMYAVLDPATGVLRVANAGHPLPYLRTDDGVVELRATGMPLGLLPGMVYEEQEFKILPGQEMLLYSDGIAEAHNGEGEMFGFPRVARLVCASGGKQLIDEALQALHAFTGPSWEQEDDITIVTVRRAASPLQLATSAAGDEQLLAHFTMPSEPGSERAVAARVLELVAPLALPRSQADRLGTAVAESAMNAIEHGNHNDPALPVTVEVARRAGALVVRVTDCGPGPDPTRPQVEPDLEAKLLGEQSPRGWGLFLIRSMVDELNVFGDGDSHTLELVLREDPEHLWNGGTT